MIHIWLLGVFSCLRLAIPVIIHTHTLGPSRTLGFVLRAEHTLFINRFSRKALEYLPSSVPAHSVLVLLRHCCICRIDLNATPQHGLLLAIILMMYIYSKSPQLCDGTVRRVMRHSVNVAEVVVRILYFA